MTSINTVDLELLADLVGDIEGLGIEMLYLRAAKDSIRKAITDRNVSLDLICAAANKRLRKLGLTVDVAHVQAILEGEKVTSDERLDVFQSSLRGRAPPAGTLCLQPADCH